MRAPIALLFTCLILFGSACRKTPPPAALGSGYTFNGGVPTQAGSPSGLNQNTLIIYVRASDDNTPNLGNLRTSEQAEFDTVNTFYGEESFNKLSFSYTHAPNNNNWYQLPKTYDSYMWTQTDIDNAPDAASKQTAQDNQALVQDFWGFFGDSLQAATTDGFNVGNFTQVAVVIIGPFHRGTSYGSTNFTLKDSNGNDFQVSVPIVVVSTNKGFSRTAHEFGHAFGGFADLYNAVNRALGNWDMMDCTDCTDQTTGWHKDKKAGWFAGSQLKVLTRPTGVNQISDTTTLIPYETQNPAAGAVQSIRLDVGGSMHLYVENRQKINGQAGSQQLPANAVIITDADDSADQVNASRPPILLFGGPISSGGQFADQAYGDLKIQVSGTAPNLQVKIDWGPDPFFDLNIRPWTPPPYESPDIWVDSQVNGFDTYEYSDAAANPGVPGNPVLNGDRPRTGRANRLYARVFNSGTSVANNVRVSFYVTTPEGIGDSGNWTLIDRATIAQIAGQSSAIAMVNWQPNAATHTCVKAQIDVQPGELNANNNLAQENVGDFDTTSASPWKVVTSSLQISNPTKLYRSFRLEMNGLPANWTGWVSERFFYLAPGEVKTIRYRIDPSHVSTEKYGARVPISIAGWMLDGNRERLLGGITAVVHLVRPSTIRIGDMPKESSLEELSKRVVQVFVGPPEAGLPVALDFAEAGGAYSTMANTKTDASGKADFNLGDLIRKHILKLEPGKTYKVRADLYGSPTVAAATSAEITLIISR